MSEQTKIKYAVACENCRGYGYFIEQVFQSHPYGDTYAVERYLDQIECVDCGGIHNLVETDMPLCHLCSDSIDEVTDTRVDDFGYTVHKDCVDRDPYGAKTIHYDCDPSYDAWYDAVEDPL